MVAALAGLVVLQFATLRVTPPGFYVDEATTGAHVVSMLADARDANGTPWPFFSQSLGGGYTTPVYLYPLVGWAAIFGDSEYALRAFSTFITIAAVLVLGLGMRYWLGQRGMYATWFVGLLLPWAWLGGSLAWDPVMVPLFTATAWYCFSRLVHDQRHRLLLTLGLGTTLVLAAYVYPPCRVSAPLLLLASGIYLLRARHINIKQATLTAVWCAVIVVPLALFMFSDEAMGRSEAISVFGQANPLAAVGITLYNYLQLLNPLNLFVTGDPNLRHSTGVFGMLGGVGLVGILGLTYLKRGTVELRLTLLATVGIVLSLLGSALTIEGQPHYLRATAAWPFFVAIIVCGWCLIQQHATSIIRTAAFSVAGVMTVFYTVDLVFLYPTRSAESFDYTTRQLIQFERALGIDLPIDYPEKAMIYYDKR